MACITARLPDHDTATREFSNEGEWRCLRDPNATPRTAQSINYSYSAQHSNISVYVGKGQYRTPVVDRRNQALARRLPVSCAPALVSGVERLHLLGLPRIPPSRHKLRTTRAAHREIADGDETVVSM